MLLLLAKTPYSNSSIWFERKLLKKGKIHAQTFLLFLQNFIKIEKITKLQNFQNLQNL